ncbi:MAG: F0F1 ATP synthase subunit B [Methylococcaceae bacterium]
MSMEFDFSTFILEMLNFLVLVWILQRLFYKPLLATIAQRKLHIEDTLAKAQSVQQEAEAQRELYENRQKLWEQEKQIALVVLHQDLDVERRAQFDLLQKELEQERQRNQANLSRQQHEFEQHAQQLALKNAARFAHILVQHTASAELETKLVQFLVEQLKTLPDTLNASFQRLQNPPVVNISSAFPLDAIYRQQLADCFSTLIVLPLTFHYAEEAMLLAGLRIELGSWVLQANLQHELSGFAELVHDFE